MAMNMPDKRIRKVAIGRRQKKTEKQYKNQRTVIKLKKQAEIGVSMMG